MRPMLVLISAALLSHLEFAGGVREFAAHGRSSQKLAASTSAELPDAAVRRLVDQGVLEDGQAELVKGLEQQVPGLLEALEACAERSPKPEPRRPSGHYFVVPEWMYGGVEDEDGDIFYDAEEGPDELWENLDNKPFFLSVPGQTVLKPALEIRENEADSSASLAEAETFWDWYDRHGWKGLGSGMLVSHPIQLDGDNDWDEDDPMLGVGPLPVDWQFRKNKSTTPFMDDPMGVFDANFEVPSLLETGQDREGDAASQSKSIQGLADEKAAPDLIFSSVPSKLNKMGINNHLAPRRGAAVAGISVDSSRDNKRPRRNEVPSGAAIMQQHKPFVGQKYSKVNKPADNQPSPNSQLNQENSEADDTEDSCDGESPVLPAKEAAQVIIDAASLTADKSLDHGDFQAFVGDGKMTACKKDEVQQALQMSQFMKHEEKCEKASRESEFAECVNKDQFLQQSFLAVPLDKADKPPSEDENMLPECKCADGEDLMSAETLQEKWMTEDDDETLEPFVLRNAADRYCMRRSETFVAYLNVRCKPLNGEVGYCCADMETKWQAAEGRQKKQYFLEKAVMFTAQLITEVVESSADLYDRVKHVLSYQYVPAGPKTMLYKYYVVHYHHAQLLLKKHAYCRAHPMDLHACDDPEVSKATWSQVGKALRSTRKSIEGLVSCIVSGARPLGEELWNPVGLLGNILRRSVHLVTSGRLQERVGRLAYALGQTIWRHRFGIIVTGIVIGASGPLMEAISATVMTTGAATSMGLAFTQLLRNVAVHVACPLMTNPILVGMFTRWAMANIVLTDWFIDSAIKPLWDLIQASMPLTTLAKTAWSLIRKMLEKIQKLAGDGKAGERKTWLEAAREFHQSVAADLLYGFIAIWFDYIWRVAAESLCGAAKIALGLANGAQSVVHVTERGFFGFVQKIMRAASGAVKNVIGNSSGAVQFDMMKAEDEAQFIWSHIPEKILKAGHLGLSAVSWSAGTLSSGTLDMVNIALNKFAKTSIFVGLPGFFSWLFTSWFYPSDHEARASDVLLRLDATLKTFNEGSCTGKGEGDECMFLQHPGHDNEEVVVGFCCHQVCQRESADCTAVDEQASVTTAKTWDPKHSSLKTVRLQSERLQSFVKKSRKSMGGGCAERSAPQQTLGYDFPR
eukprot:TRINITY_DN24562_c0_g1_i1.p1 TRINITY_DN24562_c0_g1~~TRINITY_DN24562_c0_g1_i1.p1  ORF type:complete len:1160 (-),score=263.65 TRINITY_DN24562_c0_g1_i1:224-3646(-)